MNKKKCRRTRTGGKRTNMTEMMTMIEDEEGEGDESIMKRSGEMTRSSFGEKLPYQLFQAAHGTARKRQAIAKPHVSPSKKSTVGASYSALVTLVLRIFVAPMRDRSAGEIIQPARKIRALNTM